MDLKKSSRYREAGVDIELGDKLVDRIRPYVKRTARKGLMSGIGGFGGMFSTRTAGFKDPILVSGTDGVGTKLKVAQMMGIHDTIGIDLVAMCANDILTCGARPLFFLDYYATGKLNIKTAQSVIKGIAAGCIEAGCVLLGGETAEMPGFYGEDEYDLAGFVVGAVEKGKQIEPSMISEGDVLIGLPSSGIHSNGYSLARKVFFAKMKLSPNERLKGLKLSIGKELLRPTRIYVKTVLKVLRKHPVHGLAHITGGGITGNVPRMLPQKYAAKIDRRAWKPPAIFDILAREGKVDAEEMYGAFNMGIGMVMAVPRSRTAGVTADLKRLGERPVLMGEVVKSRKKGGVIYID